VRFPRRGDGSHARLPLAPAALMLLAVAGPLTAQVPEKKPPTPADTAAVEREQQEARREVIEHATVVRWYHVAAVLAGGAALSAVDEPVQRFTQRNRSHTLDNISGGFRQEGEPLYYAGISLGVLGVGLVSGDADIRRAGARLVTSVAISGATMEIVKMITGRSRPNEGVGAFTFHPFTSLHDSAGIETRGAFPSGHTTAAFAVATSLADDINSPIADVLLYTAATGTAWSRINDNRHWLSDTFIGAALGITTAKLVSGRWRIFNLKPPAFLVTPVGAPALGFTVPLPAIR
jgi:membrane-associated phospholipid phosphatase